jgi:hypothetical protein
LWTLACPPTTILQGSALLLLHLLKLLPLLLLPVVVVASTPSGAAVVAPHQVVPHITDAIQDWIQRVAHVPVDGRDGVPDVCVIELGGTVGDIESSPFVEALRQFHFK